MAKLENPDYSVLDQPQVTRCLFHPRFEGGYRQKNQNREDLMIPVGEGVQVAASFHFKNLSAPMILFFHGNGEIVSDYDDFGCLFNDQGLNFLVADYRGYGRSTGTPSVSSMMKDCHKIFDFVLAYMADKKMTGPFCVMGRSLGSASAIELCAARAADFNCLIIESGFAFVSPLLQTLGIHPQAIGFKEEQGFENIDKIKTFSKPCLVIHAQFDHIIPFSDGQALFDACASSDKRLLEIKGANHNDIFAKGMAQYLEQINKICFQ
ncbi:MAG: alpha/beta hydrolase [Proteobacteria bacterium]|nr:alpha/beta hydrolase [Pseudomonadota bacterium]MBU1581397.1 alpha/beta hydrolase [Pseudomonadota bacterium]MBU2628414.1 alpha/beta hydrolase [Pseudomonadota bacterium]